MIHSAQGELMPAPASVGPGPVAAAMGRQARAGGPCNAQAVPPARHRPANAPAATLHVKRKGPAVRGPEFSSRKRLRSLRCLVFLVNLSRWEFRILQPVYADDAT